MGHFEAVVSLGPNPKPNANTSQNLRIYTNRQHYTSSLAIDNFSAAQKSKTSFSASPNINSTAVASFGVSLFTSYVV